MLDLAVAPADTADSAPQGARAAPTAPAPVSFPAPGEWVAEREARPWPWSGGRISLEVALFVAIGVLALLTRFFDLGAQAQHHDESLHSYFSWLYYTGQGYTHDPLMHGPFLFHVASLSYFLFGDSDASSRYAAALFGAATVVLPFFLRRELGRWGALIASIMLLVSPSFLYFGRFHRHDVFSAFLTLLLFCMVVRFIAEPRPVWAFAGAAAWGFLFTNKEDFFIVTAIFGSALAVAILWSVAPRVLALGVGLVVALALVVKVLPRLLSWPALPVIPWENPSNSAIRAYLTGLVTHPIVLAALLLLAGFLTIASLLLTRAAGEEGWFDGLLAHEPEGTPAAGLYALLRDRRVLWTAAGISAAIYTALYTSLFSNIPGILSGSFGAIGYWLGQQGVRRAEQPWFYYLLLLPQYDPLAAILGGFGVGLTGWRPLAQRFGLSGEGPQPFVRGFIAYWAVASLAIYSWAGEKMPWMDIHMVLPLTLLAAALLGSAVEGLLARRGAAPVPSRETEPDEGVRWVTGRGRRMVPAAEARPGRSPLVPSLARDAVVGGIILVAVAAWFLRAAAISARGLPGTGGEVGQGWWVLLVPAAVIAAVTAGYGVLGGWGRAGRVVTLALASALLLFHVHTGWSLAYINKDVPKEMLVYVQSSPDVTRVMEELDLFSAELTAGKDLPLMYDSSTSWPFQWYLRDYRNKQYFDQTISEPPSDEVAIVLVGNDNLALHPELAQMLSNYVPQQYAMRWHFPEDETYRLFAIAPELSPVRNSWSGKQPPYRLGDVVGSILSSLTATAQPEHQARLFRLLAYRDLWAPLGSYDFTVYVRRDLLPQYNDLRYR